MGYIAEKPVRFDRTYYIGEEISYDVVDPFRAADLINMGLISGDIPVIKPVTPKQEIAAVVEENTAPDTVLESAPTEAYTATALAKLKKEELLHIAESLLGQSIDGETETRNSLIDIIVAAQEMSN